MVHHDRTRGQLLKQQTNLDARCPPLFCVLKDDIMVGSLDEVGQNRPLLDCP